MAVSVARSVMLRHPGLVIMIVVAVMFGVMFRVEERRLEAARTREVAAALTASNAIAERDSTRDVARANARVAALVSDSLRVVEKRVVQVAQTSDALDQALGGERKAKYELTARVDSLERNMQAGVTRDSGTRVADFLMRDPPYTVAARVEMPPPPDSARMRMRVVLDSIFLEARVRCLDPDASGVRSAALSVTSARWARVRIEHVEQGGEVCAQAVAHATRVHVEFRPVMAGVGIVRQADGQLRFGYFVGAGFAIQL